jgi:prepilin-type N-terminal cleavage/methylation domain-containing protein
MFKKIRSDRGLTLTELIVASVLVGIVMMGIVSFNVSLKNVQDTSSLGANLSLEAATTMSYLRNDIVMAFGSSADTGLFYPTLTGANSLNRSLCIRKDGGDLISTSPDDTWTCYFYEDATRLLERCVRPTTAVDPKTAPFIATRVACEAGASSIQYLTHLVDRDFYSIVPAPPAIMQYVRISLRVYDPVRDPMRQRPYPPTTSAPFMVSINPDNHTR